METPLESVMLPFALHGHDSSVEGAFGFARPRQSVGVIQDAVTVNVNTTPPTVMVSLF